MPKIGSLLIKPVSALCNLQCTYCFYLDRETDPYKSTSPSSRRMTEDTLEQLVNGFVSYSHPQASFAFQGGEPMLAGLPFYRKLVSFQKRYGSPGLSVSNSMQTNGLFLDRAWCEFFRDYNWLLGVSLDGPQNKHDAHRVNKGGDPTWRKVMDSIELLRKYRVDFNVLCVLSAANVDEPRALYRWFRRHGFDFLQFIPLSDLQPITPEQYGWFLTELFEEWWPERRKVRIRFFDNLAEALAGHTPSSCAMQERCDSYVVVEHNGDVYPCDFFVESDWKLGNVSTDDWADIERSERRLQFARLKSLPRPECAACEYLRLCHGGCPKDRHARGGRFEDLDYFCAAYKRVFARASEPLIAELRRLGCVDTVI